MREQVNRDIWPYLVLMGQVFNGWRAEQNYQTLSSIPLVVGQERADWPGLGIIIPARNEAENLPRLLNSLVQQKYPDCEILVVDDASTDKTAEVVRGYSEWGVKLLQIDGPPKNWTGKNYACWRGAQESQQSWLLFIDADVELNEQALGALLAYVLEKQYQVLSLFAFQRCETFWERVILPFAFQQYFVGVHSRKIHGKKGMAVANGQIFLVKRDVYEQAGGHAARAESLIDDVALATRLKEIGVISYVCRGEELASVRMYKSLREISAGFSKNAYLYMWHEPITGVQSAISTALAASLLLSVPQLFSARIRYLAPVLGIAYIAQALSMRSWLQRFAIPSGYAWLTPLAALTFLGIAINSLVSVISGRKLSWKGREYRVKEGQAKVEPCEVSMPYQRGDSRIMNGRGEFERSSSPLPRKKVFNQVVASEDF